MTFQHILFTSNVSTMRIVFDGNAPGLGSLPSGGAERMACPRFDKNVVIPAEALEHVHMLQRGRRFSLAPPPPRSSPQRKLGSTRPFSQEAAGSDAALTKAAKCFLERHSGLDAAWTPAFAGVTIYCVALPSHPWRCIATCVHAVELPLG